MATAREIITDAFYKITVLGTGQSLSNEDAQRGFSILNQMLSIWSVDGNMIFYTTRETFSLTGAASYTIGSGGDFNTDRPNRIVSAYTTSGTTDYWLSEYDVEQYARIDQKSDGGIPDIYYYDANYPLATLYLYPAPTSQSSITLFTEKSLTQFSSLDSDLTFPPEYETALIYTLAVWAAPEYERLVTPAVEKIATRTYKAIEGQNKRNKNNVSQIVVPRSAGAYNGYNIYRGY